MPISFATKGIEDLVIAHEADVNPLTGSASVSVPLPLTPGRSGFGPSLALQYSSSAGNSVYGIGWSLSGMATIGLTGKQHPKYDGSDEFVFNGTDELVPTLQQTATGHEPRFETFGDYKVCYFRSKLESSYIRFEKWAHATTGRIHWRIRTPDNTLSVFGLDTSSSSRIADPDEPDRTYLWLLEAQYDSNGNAIFYEYQPENAENLNFSQSYEWHRIANQYAYPQRYLKRILYGNTVPVSVDTTVPEENCWLFQVMLDYGDHGSTPFPEYMPEQSWLARLDPYSNYRAGFEIRTHRLCRQILMFHHFEELGSEPTLVGSTVLNHQQQYAGTVLTEISYAGYRRNSETGEITSQSIPSLKFEYTQPSVQNSFQAPPEQTKENFPSGFGDSRYRWIDLYGEGLPGILTETQQAWYYKPNLGNGRFGSQQKVTEKPSQQVGSYALADFDHDGNLNLVVMEGRQAGYCEYDRDREQWQSFRPFSSAPHIDSQNANTQWMDLNGDGLPDILISKQDRLTWYPSEGKEGFSSPIELAKPQSNGQPQLIGENFDLDRMFADMTGDGMLDQIHIQNGRVEYWPQLGNGRFGDCVLMEGAPDFDNETQFDPSRLRLVDLDGSGTTDLLYIGRGEIHYWINASGNRFIKGGRLMDLPYIDNLSTVQVLDFLGNGTSCLVWSSPLACSAEAPLHYLQLTNGLVQGNRV